MVRGMSISDGVAVWLQENPTMRLGFSEKFILLWIAAND